MKTNIHFTLHEDQYTFLPSYGTPEVCLILHSFIWNSRSVFDPPFLHMELPKCVWSSIPSYGTPEVCLILHSFIWNLFIRITLEAVQRLMGHFHVRKVSYDGVMSWGMKLYISIVFCATAVACTCTNETQTDNLVHRQNPRWYLLLWSAHIIVSDNKFPLGPSFVYVAMVCPWRGLTTTIWVRMKHFYLLF
jgi:hypothetical protein